MDFREINSSSNIDISRIYKVTWVGVAVNIFLAFIKLWLGIIGHSKAMIADGVHSISDLGTDFAIIFGVKFWSKPADECHPYGHGKIETAITFLIGLVLVSAAVFIAYDAFIGLRDTSSHPQPKWIAFYGALISVVFKEVLYRWTLKAGKQIKSSALMANAWHHRTDALSSIPVGIAVAAAAYNPKLSILDHIGAFVVSIFIFHAAWKIIKPSIVEFFDGGALEFERKKIEDIIKRTKGIESIHKLRTRKLGSGIYLDVHIQVNGNLSVKEGHEISGTAKTLLLKEGPNIIDVIIHIEPNS
jgi:cation diffusion facilitator family transporter